MRRRARRVWRRCSTSRTRRDSARPNVVECSSASARSCGRSRRTKPRTPQPRARDRSDHQAAAPGGEGAPQTTPDQADRRVQAAPSRRKEAAECDETTAAGHRLLTWAAVDEYAVILDQARHIAGPHARLGRARSTCPGGCAAASSEHRPRPGGRALKRLQLLASVQRARAPGTGGGRAGGPDTQTRRAGGAPTITGNMEVRRDAEGEAFVLRWDATPEVLEWVARVSERSDPRGGYAVREERRLPANATSVEVPLGPNALRVHLLGRGRGGKLVRRAVMSPLAPSRGESAGSAERAQPEDVVRPGRVLRLWRASCARCAGSGWRPGRSHASRRRAPHPAPATSSMTARRSRRCLTVPSRDYQRKS